MSDVMTTKDRFPVVDITHKPKRMQGDAIAMKEATSDAITPIVAEEETLTVVTLERAITFYSQLASQRGANSKLYLATVNWLKELLATRNVKVMQQVNAERVEVDVNNADDKE